MINKNMVKKNRYHLLVVFKTKLFVLLSLTDVTGVLAYYPTTLLCIKTIIKYEVFILVLSTSFPCIVLTSNVVFKQYNQEVLTHLI